MSRRTLRFAVRKFGPFESAVRKQWHSFERAEKTGLELEVQALDLHPLCETLFENQGLKRGEWDVATINTDWVASAHDSSAVLDLSGLLGSDPPEDFPDGWTPSLLRLQQVDGQVLGLPFHDGPECLIYRTDLFEDGTRIPQTWDEFRQAARHFTRPGENLYGTVFAAYPDGHNTVYDFCLQLWTRGGELFDRGGNMHLDTPEAVQALEFYREMLNDQSAIHPESRAFDSVKSGLAFAAGEIAMMVNWFGFAAMAETVAESRVKGRVNIAEIPHAPACPGTSLNVYWILSVGAGSPHPEIAYRFVRHCASRSMDKLLTLEGAIGCRKSTWRDPEVNRTIPFYHRLEELHANARELPRLADWPERAKLIDELMLQAINTPQPVVDLARAAQQKVLRLGAAKPACGP